MLVFTRNQKRLSASRVISSRKIEAQPIIDGDRARGLVICGPNGDPTIPTHWAFGQLAQRIGAPANYLRALPSDLASDCINHGFASRPVDEIGALLRMTGQSAPEMAAMTGPNYGRVWNADIIAALVARFGDGVTGDFTVPGEFGRAVDINKSNTTLFASDRDMFVFLADEKHKITVPNRRNGKSGEMSRGFFVWNSEVGSTTLGISTFLFDYVCANRIVWGAQGVQEIKIRHTSGAPDRFIEEVTPAVLAYANSSAVGIEDGIKAAQAAKISSREDPDAVHEFLVKRRRFTQTQAKGIMAAHLAEEGRPIQTLWDATTGITAYAKGLKHQDARVDLERAGGAVLSLAS